MNRRAFLLYTGSLIASAAAAGVLGRIEGYREPRERHERWYFIPVDVTLIDGRTDTVWHIDLARAS